jgi:predicted component of type VI protein secretion system
MVDPMEANNKEFKQKVKEFLNLDDNFAKKFGQLKKSIVLYGYERFNDAFLSIADAAQIVQKER